jgi:hypothetical protein
MSEHSEGTALHTLQVLLAMLRDLSALAPFSLLADCAHIFGMLVVLKDDVDSYTSAHQRVVAGKGVGAIPLLFGAVIYCYEGIGMVLPIEDAMQDRSKVRARCTLLNCRVKRTSIQGRSPWNGRSLFLRGAKLRACVYRGAGRVVRVYRSFFGCDCAAWGGACCFKAQPRPRPKWSRRSWPVSYCC